MEQTHALKQLESRLCLLTDHLTVMSSKLEDLVFRAQRIAHALKDDPKARISDTMFGYDLQNFRRDVRAFGNDAMGLSSVLGAIERAAQYDEASLVHAQAVMRFTDRLHKSMCGLLDQAVLAHQHIRMADHKVEAWYLMQEAETLSQQTQVLPGIANKVLIAVSTPGGASGAPGQPAPPSRTSVPLRPLGGMSPKPPSDPKR